MTRFTKLLAALTAIFFFFPLTVQSAQADEEPKLNPIGRFASCVRGGGKGSVLLLLDRSGSLADTDPEGARVASANYFVSSLAKGLGSVEGSSVQIAVAGFDSSFEKSLDWTDLNESTLESVKGDISSYANKNDGQDTDYWLATDGARRELASRNSGEVPSCAMLVWFSDGNYVIPSRKSDAEFEQYGGAKPYDPENNLRNPASGRAAVAKGVEDMCRAGGIADQLRSMEIVTIGIGLAVKTKDGAFDLMRGFSSGEGQKCGEKTEPSPGQFLMATDVDQLILAFESALHPVPTPPVETGLCRAGEEPCSEGTRVFVLDGSIGRVQGIANVPKEGDRVLLKTRTEELVALEGEKGSKEVSGAKIDWEWMSKRSVAIEIERVGQSPEWVGPWGLVFVTPKEPDGLAQSSLRLLGDIAPTLLNSDSVSLNAGGDPAELKLGFVDHNGAQIDPSTLSEKSFISASFTTSDGKSTELATQLVAREAGNPLTLDPKLLAPGNANLRLTLEVTTSDWEGDGQRVEGTKLEPVRAMVPLVVAPPAEFPTIAQSVSFGETELADPVTKTIALEGEGCVWLDEEVTFTGTPQGVENPVLSSPAKSADTCSTSGLELTLAPGATGNGALVGDAQVWLKSPTSADGIKVKLAFDLQMSRPASQPVLWSTLVGVTALGIIIPIILLYVVKAFNAKIPGQSVFAQQLRGQVNDSFSFADGGLGLDMSQMQIRHLVNGRRQVDIAGVMLRAKMGLSPTEPGYVVVEQPGKAAGGRTVLSSIGDRAKLPLSVQGNWTVALDPTNPVGGDVTVTVFTSPEAPGLKELENDVRTNLREAVAKLRQGLPPEAGGAPADPWSSPPSGQGQGLSGSWDSPGAGVAPSGWGGQPQPPNQSGGWGGTSQPPQTGGWAGGPPAPGQPPQGGSSWQNNNPGGQNPPLGGGW